MIATQRAATFDDTGDGQIDGRPRPSALLDRPSPVPRAVLFLIVLYVAAWGGLLFSAGGIYWDDWIYVSMAPDQILQMTRELGLPWVGYLLQFLWGIGPVASHALSLVIYFSVGMSTLGILRRVPWLTPNERVFVAALVLVLPLMAARHTLIVQHYALSLALFFLGWYLLVRASPPTRATLWVAGVLFVASFTTNSLLPFYLLPMVHFWYQNGRRTGVPLRHYLSRYWPLLILPGAWYIAKVLWFQPYGLYDGYNAVTLRAMWRPTVWIVVAAVPLGGLYTARRQLGARTLGILTPLFAGAFMTVLAIYPYVVVGKKLPFAEWETRDELLMPIGVAVLVLAFCRMVGAALGRNAARVAGLASLAASVVLSMSICAGYLLDWQKEEALVELFKTTPALQSATTVIFDDQTRGANIFHRTYRFYEWNGLMRRAYGTETRFGVNDTPEEIRGSSDRPTMRGSRATRLPRTWAETKSYGSPSAREMPRSPGTHRYPSCPS